MPRLESQMSVKVDCDGHSFEVDMPADVVEFTLVCPECGKTHGLSAERLAAARQAVAEYVANERRSRRRKRATRH